MLEIRTDLNERERAGYAEQLQNFSEIAAKAADALRGHRDTEAMAHVMILLLSGSFLKELLDIAQAALKRAKEQDEFPSVIGG